MERIGLDRKGLEKIGWERMGKDGKGEVSPVQEELKNIQKTL